MSLSLFDEPVTKKRATKRSEAPVAKTRAKRGREAPVVATPSRVTNAEAPPPEPTSLAAPLLTWFDSARRDLPWRHDRTGYRVWVSEVMLQQTRVSTVIPYYGRFLEVFPTVEALAAAEIDQVLALWSGLGYYRRARGLHEGAREVVARFGGQVPGTVEGLRQPMWAATCRAAASRAWPSGCRRRWSTAT